MNRFGKMGMFCAGVLAASVLAGCAEMIIGAAVGTSEGLREVERQQIRYCGPDGKANLERDKKGSFWTRPLHDPNFDKMCGKADITFERTTEQRFDPTKVDKLEFYKIVGHFKGHEENVRKNESPLRPYTVIGILRFPRRWYYANTINEYMREKLSEVGADAILEYHTYQDAAMLRESEATGEMLNVYRMRMEAKVIRFKD